MADEPMGDLFVGPGFLSSMLYSLDYPMNQFILGSGSIPTLPDPDIIPPVIGNFDPTPGSQLARTDSISFDVTDDSGQFTRIFVIAAFSALGNQEVVHDGDNFVGRYSSGNSSRVPITNGFRYTVARSSGWPDEAPTMRIIPIDAEGNTV